MDKPSQKDPSLIVAGMYCYHGDKVCPYWSCEVEYDDLDWLKVRPVRYGKCAFTGENDRDDKTSGLLWDQVKTCGINDDFDDDEEVIVIN